MLLHHPPLHLERRRQLARLDAEIPGQQQQLLGHLELGQVPQRRPDLPLHLRLHLRQRQQRRRVARGALLRPPRRPASSKLGTISMMGNRRRSPNITALETNLLRLGQALDRLRRDVLAARGDDQVLLAVGDLEEPVRVEQADVAGVEPAVAVDRLGGGLRASGSSPS